MTDARKPRKCQIIMLDERRLDLLVQPRLMSCDLLDMVASQVGLHEKEYFGLSYTDETSHQTWLRLDRKVLDHDLPRYQDPFLLVFCVRFFVPNILILKETSTVELFFLQARILIFKGTIQCDSETVFELAALALHANSGDYTSDEAARADLRKLPVLPTRTLKERPSITFCEDKVLDYYKKSAGQTRGESVVRYLVIFQSLPTYGVHYYEVKDKSNIPWWLGLSPKGIGLYDHGDKIKPRKIFMWSQIENIYFRDRKFSIEIRDSYRYEFKDSKTRVNTIGRKHNGAGNMMVHAWFSSTGALAKTMWSMAISQHQFYLDKKQVEAKITLRRSLRDMARELSQSTGSLPSSTSDSIRTKSDQSRSMSSLTMNGSENLSSLPKAAEREMLTALAARKEALLEKLKERTEELKSLCMQEAELTGEYPLETPYTPGSPLPPIRRRVGTAFEFSEFIISGEKDEDEEIKSMAREIEIQSQITTAAQKLAEDRSVNKNVRKTRKLTYQKSLRRLKDMEGNLERLKKSRSVVDINHDEEGNRTGEGFYHVNSTSDGPNYSQTERLSPQRYRTSVNLSVGSKGSTVSAESLHDRDSIDRGSYSGPPSPVISPYRKTPTSPTARAYHGFSETRRQHSPLANGPRAGRFSPRGENNRSVPAFQYSDSDTRSDSSTKPSSVSSYANSEDNGDNIEPYWHQRRIGNSCESLDENHVRGPSPRMFVNRSAEQSSESLNSDHEGSPSPFSPVRNPRSFSLSARPSNLKIPTVKYLNSSDLGIISTSGTAGSYSLNHTSRLSPNLASKGFISTSLSKIDRPPPSLSNMNLRTARSQVNMSTMPYLTSPGYYRKNQFSELSIYEEDLLEWRANDESEATLV
ncbi:FERM domain-containing protein 4A-like isoform X1 [Stylophora pistillata]|uniref:FERM domain-containing protein 4A n=1 Tax=Stylophora pistillata TaxID=50429 RepID=A0A2B4SYK9_STYPI|nr:FERM domain-containing protein 4A-like isoform X1 [Stylophora pistillata]PFX33465.1 FERM domain-containing protein 4A [Stylophora pistillata]